MCKLFTFSLAEVSMCLSQLSISTLSESALDKNAIAHSGLSLSQCWLGGFHFAQLRSIVFVQTQKYIRDHVYLWILQKHSSLSS